VERAKRYNIPIGFFRARNSPGSNPVVEEAEYLQARLRICYNPVFQELIDAQILPGRRASSGKLSGVKSMDVSGKITIITGASEGIGRATARCFAEAGAKVVLVARSCERLEELAEELRLQKSDVFCSPADMRNPDAVQRMVDQAYEHFGRIDILVNNAGQSAAGPVAQIDIGHFREIMELNVYGALFAIQAVVPKMRLGGGGVILNISSMVSKLRLPGLGTYAATKAALNALSVTARVELAAENIRVITVFPRTTATDFGKHAVGDMALRERQRTRAASSGQPVDSPEHVAMKILQAAQTEPEEIYMEG
jgi:short-subunit dehydrogenase